MCTLIHYLGFMAFFKLYSWMFQHDWTPTVFECLICVCFVFLYLHLFSAIEHVVHEGALEICSLSSLL